MKIPVILIASALLNIGFTSGLRAEEAQIKPIYELLFKDGSLANSGTVSGEAKEVNPPEGKPTFEIVQDSNFGKWVLKQSADENSQKGPYLVLPDSKDRLRLSNPAQAASVSLWINWTGPINHPDSRQMIINCLSSGYKKGWALSVTKKGGIRFDWTGEGSTSGHRITENTITPGQWHHLVLVWENRPQVYIDGIPAAFTMPFYETPMAISDSPLVIGADILHFLPLRGSLAEIRIYDAALSPGAISHFSQKKP
jgi:hypothetical protein